MKVAFITLASCIAVELCSLAAFFYPPIALPLLVLIFFATLYLFWRDPVLGVYVLGSELIIGSFGRLIAYHEVSLRMVLFAAFLIATIVQKKCTFRLAWPFFALLAVVALQTVAGFLHYPFVQVVHDANSYAFFILAFPVIALRDRINLRILMHVLATAFSWLTLKTFLVFALFTHLAQPFLYSWPYHWIRDSRIGEITGFGNGIVRVFFQSHIFAAVACVVIIASYFFHREYTRPHHHALLCASFVVLLISLSRSMWIGTAVALVVVCSIILVHKKFSLTPLKYIAACAIVAGTMLAGSYYMPVGAKPTAPLLQLFILRGEDLKNETAARSRWQELPVLWHAIEEKPLLGHGFGYSIAIDGVNRPAFEWGWLDMWIKIGAVGVAAYFALLYVIVKKSAHREYVLPVIVLLTVTHIFTPYLNHPLGIGVVIAALAW